jgi:hypothetical protein
MSTEETIFAEALDKGSSLERAAYLEAACAGNAPMRESVEALLLAHERAAGILEAHPLGLDIPSEITPTSEAIGSTIGPYKLLQQIGEGGMAVVVLAEQSGRCGLPSSRLLTATSRQKKVILDRDQ